MEEITGNGAPYPPGARGVEVEQMDADQEPVFSASVGVGISLSDFPSIDCVIQELFTCCEKGISEASSFMKEYLSWAVPCAYHMHLNKSPLDKEQVLHGCSTLAQLFLFPVINGFLDKDGKLTEYLKALSTERPSTCGQMFKPGEPTYCCRDCAQDPTCVLCADCFKNSRHKNHRYTISTSNGGGYCDCGDVEAWKQDVNCDLHQPQSLMDSTRTESPVDQELEQRVRFLFKVLLNYACQILTSELALTIPEELVFRQRKPTKDGDEMTKCPKQMVELISRELFCTVLYNDEVHTFDMVINSLTQALECSKRDAAEYATIVDQEGRAIVKIGSFPDCFKAKQAIEQYTMGTMKPLKVSVMQEHVISHQMFAIKVVKWIEGLLEKSGAFRNLFATILEEVNDGARCLLDEVIQCDTKMWKAARKAWHHLLIVGMLKDYPLKKMFASAYARNYNGIIQNLGSDDHDYPYSIASLAVQILTVPSIAHFLIEDQNIMSVIISSLINLLKASINADGKFELTRRSYKASVKQSDCLFMDMKYILTVPPSTWTQGLTKNFNLGMDRLLQFLSYMQGMEPVTRQTDNHVEFEAEWESAFDLHFKLQSVISLSLQWLATSKSATIHAFRTCLEALEKHSEGELVRMFRSKTFANHSAMCQIYKVSSMPVSVYLPLSRYLAGMYVHLEKFGLEFSSTEFEMEDKLTPVTPELLMEPCLCMQVLMAQAHAQIWIRNGTSIQHQLYLYASPGVRTEMLDKDIIILQIAAALLEPNQFLIQVFNRFELLPWMDLQLGDLGSGKDHEELQKVSEILLAELLGFLIILVSARFVPNVGQVSKRECVKKEVIQLLCIEPMAHSSITKGLSQSMSADADLDRVIEEVAVFKKSNLYELKPEFYGEYDWHYWHYNRESMSRAEETQRERKRGAKEAEYFPPPKLPPFTSAFSKVVNLLASDVLLKLISLVLRCVLGKAENSESFNDSHLRKVLHLLGLGVNEEGSGSELGFCDACRKWEIFELLESLLKQGCLAQYHGMIKWIKREASKHSMCENSEENNANVSLSPPAQCNEEEKNKRARLAAETKAKMMAKMAAAQQKFMAVNAEQFAAAEEDTTAMDIEVPSTEPHASSVCLGPNKSPCRPESENEVYVCILCKEEHELSDTSKPFVLAAFIQRSSVLCENRGELHLKEQSKSTEFVEKGDFWFRRSGLLSPHISSCGHIMHENCWKSHVASIVNRESQRPHRLRQSKSFQVENDEWPCPLCDCLCNAALPMALPLQKLYQTSPEEIQAYVANVLQSVINRKEGKKPTPPGESVLPLSELIAKAKIYFPMKEDGESATSDDNQRVSYRAWIRGIDNLECVSYTMADGVCVPQCSHPDRGHLLYCLHAHGLPGEGFLQLFHGHSYKASSNYHNLFRLSLRSFMIRVVEISHDRRLEGREETFLSLQQAMWQGVAYTILSAEAYHRDQKVCFFGENVPIRGLHVLKFLTRACSVAVDYRFGVLPLVQAQLFHLQSCLWHANPFKPCVLELDAFGLLVQLTYFMPFTLYDTYNCSNIQVNDASRLSIQPPVGSLLDHHNLRLIYTLHVFQLIVSMENMDQFALPHDENSQKGQSTCTWQMIDGSMRFDSPEKMRALLCHLWGWPRLGNPIKQTFASVEARLDVNKLWDIVSDKAIPFLRCCAKFYECMTGVASPPALGKLESSFEDLAGYLDLPKSFYELFDCPEVVELCLKWCKHPNMSVDNISQESLYQLSLPRKLTKLVDLPTDYTDLISSVSQFKCANKCDKAHDSRMPTMCLICGEILCSQSYCCRQDFKSENVGACTYHSYFCGGGTGIFLRIRECRVFMLSGTGRGCHMSPPYLDQYGETDQGLRRGNPLTLNQEKYDMLRRLWISHSIPEEVSRATERQQASFTLLDWSYL